MRDYIEGFIGFALLFGGVYIAMIIGHAAGF